MIEEDDPDEQELSSSGSVPSNTKLLKKISLESLEINNETLMHLTLNTKLETLNLCQTKGLLVDGLILIISSLKM